MPKGVQAHMEAGFTQLHILRTYREKIQHRSSEPVILHDCQIALVQSGDLLLSPTETSDYKSVLVLCGHLKKMKL